MYNALPRIATAAKTSQGKRMAFPPLFTFLKKERPHNLIPIQDALTLTKAERIGKVKNTRPKKITFFNIVFRNEIPQKVCTYGPDGRVCLHSGPGIRLSK